MTSSPMTLGYRLPVVTAFSRLSPTRTRARDGAYTPKPGNQPVTGNRSAPPDHVTILRHCRCQDCEHWIRHPYNECRHGIIRNGVKEQPEYPAEAWHYCALYRGPQISKDVFVWPRATSH